MHKVELELCALAVLSNIKVYLSNSQSDDNDDPHDDNNKLDSQIVTAEVESWEVFIHRDGKHYIC
jgi:hypothetical protein